MSNAEAAAIRKRYTDEALSLVPPERMVVERNAAITGAYARWYLEHPALLKWAGMAAFASHRVGLALAPFEFDGREGAPGMTDKSGARRDELLDDADLTRETNNAVYADLAWAHLAYVDPAGGRGAVEAGLAGVERTHFRVLEGFKLIDRGRMLLERGRTNDGHAAVWEGNALLLEHEQLVTAQPSFERYAKGYDLFMSAFTTINFSANAAAVNWENGTSFLLFMTTGGHRQVPFATMPDVCNADQRWFWFEKRVLPMWQRLEQSDRGLRDALGSLACGREPKSPPVAT